MEPNPSACPSRSVLVRAVLYGAGVVALVLAVAGVVLPGLPTTPFVILAAACFVRASPRAHAWLLANRQFGPLLKDWEQHRAISRRARRFALGAMTASAGISVVFWQGRPEMQLTIAAAAALGVLAVLRLKVRD